jgi:DNA-binding MarR family transcriptional regulator
MVKRLTNSLQGRPTPLGTLLSTAGQRLSAELDQALHDAGFADLRAAHAPVFMVIDADGTRITDLAARTHMTKQAVGELVRYLARCGYLEITTDAADRRARVVTLTDRGWSAIDTGEQVIDGFDHWLSDAIGDVAVGQLRDALTRITETR